MSTPRYIMEAVASYLEGNDEPLIQMFKNGVPLNRFPETCEIITNCIKGKANKRAGGREATRRQRAIHYQILMNVAELVGAGFAVISNGSNSKRSACSIVADGLSRAEKDKSLKLKANTIYKEIWLPSKESEAVKKQMEMGKQNKNALLELFSTGWNE